MRPLFFLHGMESSPRGTKAQRLKNRFPNCQIPALPPRVDQRARIIEDRITEPAWLIGSSLGGLSALLFAMKRPERVKGLVLFAPAVGFFDPAFLEKKEMERVKTTFIPAGIPSIVVAGEEDAVIPMTDIREMIDRSPDASNIEFITVMDDHSLNRDPDFLIRTVERMVIHGQ